MQNLLREFRTLYEERLARLENAPQNQHNLKARNEVYQHYVHVMGFILIYSQGKSSYREVKTFRL